MSFRFLSDEQLLAQCRVETVRGSGPGGQKRNKTSNCVRLTHGPTGIHAQAGEDRSLRVNQIHAIRRLRMKLAVEIREPINAAHFEPPDWLLANRQNQKIQASYHHPYHAPTMGLILDLMQATTGSPADVAAMLGISTTQVVKFLEKEPLAWTEANRIRTDFGQKPLTHRAAK